MSHEQSETVQLPSGKWVNVYGRNTPQKGQTLPNSGEFGTVNEAVMAAKKRSALVDALRGTTPNTTLPSRGASGSW